MLKAIEKHDIEKMKKPLMRASKLESGFAASLVKTRRS